MLKISILQFNSPVVILVRPTAMEDCRRVCRRTRQDEQTGKKIACLILLKQIRDM